MQIINCPVCHESASRQVWQKTYSGLTVTTVWCPACGLVYHNPVVEDSDRQQLGLTHRQLHTNEGITPRQLARVQRRVEHQRNFLETAIRPGWRTLEIGCGLGLLSHWLTQQGCRVTGLEPDSQQAQYARQRFGLEVLNSRFEEAHLTPGYDFFAASHVIEHFPEPLAFLARLRSLAAPGACLFLETPNILAPKVGPRRLFSLAHNFYFSPQTLSAALAQSGWQVEKTRIFRRDSFLILARADQPRNQAPDPGQAQEVWRAITRHRRVYYLSLLFLWRKIPWWRRYWMYGYTDYTGPWPPERQGSPDSSVESG